MSNIENDRYEETMVERFRELNNGASKKKMIDELREMGFDRTADQLIEDWYTERTAWLHDLNLKNEDILKDDDGREYYLDVIEMDEGEGGDYQKSMVTVPDHLQVTYWLSA